MVLRHKIRRKDGKEHRYRSIVYLGEINDAQSGVVPDNCRV